MVLARAADAVGKWIHVPQLVLSTYVELIDAAGNHRKPGMDLIRRDDLRIVKSSWYPKRLTTPPIGESRCPLIYVTRFK